jgi:molecular chaperone DnaK
VDADVKGTIESAAGELRSALEGADAEAIRTSTQALHEASYKLAEVVYQSTGAGGGSAEGGSTPPSDEAEEEVIEDAEIVDEGDHARS